MERVIDLVRSAVGEEAAGQTTLRAKQVARMLEAHEVPPDMATVVGLMLAIDALAKQLDVPRGLMVMLFIHAIHIPVHVTTLSGQSLDLTPEEEQLLQRQMHKMRENGALRH